MAAVHPAAPARPQRAPGAARGRAPGDAPPIVPPRSPRPAPIPDTIAMPVSDYLTQDADLDPTDRFIASNAVTTLGHRNDPEGTYLLGLLLSVKVGEYQRPLVTFRTGAPTPGSNKSARDSGRAVKSYDRLLMFADLQDPGGTCFSVLCGSKEHSFKFFVNIHNNEGVGNIFMIYEPDHTETKLGHDNAVLMISDVSHVYPLKHHSAKYLKTIAPTTTMLVGATSFFCMHNQSIRFAKAKLAAACCGGTFCDRQSTAFEGNRAYKCGCFTTAQGNKLVMQSDVFIPCSRQFDRSEEIHVSQFRSYQTTKLFTKKEEWWKTALTNDRMRKSFRRVVSDIVGHINNNGGWTIVGWARMGAQKDDSDPKDSDNFAAETVRCHLVYVYPTHESLVNAAVFTNRQWPQPQDIANGQP